jgi:hypothetical protein
VICPANLAPFAASGSSVFPKANHFFSTAKSVCDISANSDGPRDRYSKQARGHCLVIGERAARKVAPGQTVKLQLRFPGGFRTAKFKFTRPM